MLDHLSLFRGRCQSGAHGLEEAVIHRVLTVQSRYRSSSWLNPYSLADFADVFTGSLCLLRDVQSLAHLVHKALKPQSADFLHTSLMNKYPQFTAIQKLLIMDVVNTQPLLKHPSLVPVINNVMTPCRSRGYGDNKKRISHSAVHQQLILQFYCSFAPSHT